MSVDAATVTEGAHRRELSRAEDAPSRTRDDVEIDVYPEVTVDFDHVVEIEIRTARNQSYHTFQLLLGDASELRDKLSEAIRLAEELP